MAENFLVCGGAGGIGKALCQELATQGYRPIVGYNSNAAAAQTIATETGGSALALDLTSDASIQQAIETLAADAVPLAGVVLAASPAPVIVPFGKIEVADMALQWRVNVEGPRQLVAGLVRQCFRAQKSGTVIAVLTEAMGTETNPTSRSMGAYIMAKFGLLGMMRVLAVEYPWLKTDAVYPGFTETAMLGAFDPRYLDTVRATLPGGKFATPNEVAQQIIACITQPQKAAV